MACPHPTFFPEVLNNLAEASALVQTSSARAGTYRGISLYFKGRHEEETEIKRSDWGIWRAKWIVFIQVASSHPNLLKQKKVFKRREEKRREEKRRDEKRREEKRREEKRREEKRREGKRREGTESGREIERFKRNLVCLLALPFPFLFVFSFFVDYRWNVPHSRTIVNLFEKFWNHVNRARVSTMFVNRSHVRNEFTNTKKLVKKLARIWVLFVADSLPTCLPTVFVPFTDTNLSLSHCLCLSHCWQAHWQSRRGKTELVENSPPECQLLVHPCCKGVNFTYLKVNAGNCRSNRWTLWGGAEETRDAHGTISEPVGTLRYTTAGCYYGYFGREGLGCQLRFLRKLQTD